MAQSLCTGLLQGNHQSSIVRVLLSCMLAYLLSSGTAVSGKDDLRKYRAVDEPQSEVQQFNSFAVRDLSRKPEAMVTFNTAMIVVKLLTPLNSEFNKEGDTIQAEVLESNTGAGRWWLPPGTILTGCVERADHSNYAQTNARLYIRFYDANCEGKTFTISSLPDTRDTAIHPSPKKLSTKGKIRNVLMAATFVAVPLAVGTFGTSVAITAGAGAVIGGVLADDGKHIQGAISGAWEGSGLGVLDPIVRKGAPAILPADTKIALQLREPAQVPLSVVKLARQKQLQGDKPSPAASLATQAKIVKPLDVAAVQERCNQLLEQKNLASALALLDQSLRTSPDNETLSTMRSRVLQEIGATDISSSDSEAAKQ